MKYNRLKKVSPQEHCFRLNPALLISSAYEASATVQGVKEPAVQGPDYRPVYFDKEPFFCRQIPARGWEEKTPIHAGH